MQSLILTDSFFASREGSLLSRLEIGLADEGVRLIHAVPRGTKVDRPVGVYSKVMLYSPKTLVFLRTMALNRLMRELEVVNGKGEETQIDIVHVFGGSVWPLGAMLAAELGAGLVLEVWRSGLIDRARAIKMRNDDAPLLLAPDTAIERALRAGAQAGSGVEPTIRLAAWGVLTPSTARPVLGPDRAPTAMIVGSGRDAPAFHAALEGLAEVARRRPDLLIFCDALAARRAGLWAHARRLGLLPNLSLIEEFEGRRDLLLDGDILIQPDANGEQRSIVLEAMAGGMVVIAASDPHVSILEDGRTARLVRRGDAADWKRVLLDVSENPEQARVLADRAREYVRQNRKASDHVRSVLAAYEWLSSEQAIPFAG
jgi:hypothetical protein